MRFLIFLLFISFTAFGQDRKAQLRKKTLDVLSIPEISDLRSIGEPGLQPSSYGGLTTAIPGLDSGNVAIHSLNGNTNNTGTSGASLFTAGDVFFTGLGFFGRKNVARVEWTGSAGGGLWSNHPHYQVGSSNDYTVGFWVKIRRSNLTNDIFGAWDGVGNGGNNRSILLQYLGDGTDYFQLSTSPDGAATVSDELDRNYRINRDKWFHVAMSNQASSDIVTIYINGEPIFSELKLHRDQAPITLTLGGQNGSGGGGRCVCDFQDYFFSNQVLSKEEVGTIVGNRYTNHSQISMGHKLTSDSYDGNLNEYSFYNLDSLNDNSSNSRNLTAEGGIVVGNSVGVDGIANSATEYDGVDDALSSTDGFFNFTRSFTLAAWFKMRDWRSPDDRVTFFSLNNEISGTDRSYILRSEADSREIDLFVYDNGATAGIINYADFARQEFDNGSWHHITWVVDHGVGRVYFDGELRIEAIHASFGDIYVGSNTFSLGRNRETNPVNNDYFKGWVDEFFASSRALTHREIEVLASAKINHNLNIPPEDQGWGVVWQDEESEVFTNPVYDWVTKMTANNIYVDFSKLDPGSKVKIRMR
jgi:hypothetical protein